MNYNGEVLLKCSVDEKIDFIFMHYQKDLQNVKGQNPWEIYKKTTKVRNEMIHYKKTYIGDGIGIPDFKLGGQGVAQFFTQQNMTKIKNGYVRLAELISTNLGLNISKDIQIFECDGRDGLVNYVYSKTNTNIDESRYE